MTIVIFLLAMAIIAVIIRTIHNGNKIKEDRDQIFIREWRRRYYNDNIDAE